MCTSLSTLEKTGLDVTSFSNYRPIVIEKVIAQQLNTHLTRNGLHDTMQSAYKQGSSTETALLRIKADIEEVLDAGDGVLLVLLDLSAAFDTVDHTILLDRLNEEVGLQDTALQWMRSYLSGPTQAVHINNYHRGKVQNSPQVKLPCYNSPQVILPCHNSPLGNPVPTPTAFQTETQPCSIMIDRQIVIRGTMHRLVESIEPL